MKYLNLKILMKLSVLVYSLLLCDRSVYGQTVVVLGDTYLNETRLDFSWLCNEQYLGQIDAQNTDLWSWIYYRGINRSDYYIETKSTVQDAYFFFEPGVTIYNPVGVCMGYSNRAYGRMFFGREFKFSRINAERELISAEKIAIRSDNTAGALVRASVNYQSGWVPSFGGSPGAKMRPYIGYSGSANQYYFLENKGLFYLSIYYLDNNGSWVLAGRKQLNYHEYTGASLHTSYHRNLTVEARLPRSIEATITKAAIEVGSSVWDPKWINGLPLDISMFSFQVETCVPDLVSGNCL